MAKGAYIGIPTLKSSLGDLDVGSTIKLNVDGTATDFLVVHQGNPDTSMYDASCDGTWLLMKDCYTSTYWDANTTTTTYSESSIHPYLNSDFFGLLDSNIQAITKRVKLPYTLKTGTSGEVMSLENGVDTKVFLLATAEVGVGTGFSYNDGACIDYFAGTAEIDSKRIAYVKNASGNLAKTIWYLRTPQNSGQYLVDVVTTEGKGSNDWVNRNYGIRPALILPSNLALVNGTVDGSEAGWQDVARKIKKGYVGIPKSEYEPVFADNSWSQIIKACQKNEVPSTWAVGDQKAMDIGGTEYLIDIIGKDHDDYADGSGKAPLTFQMHDCYPDTLSMNSSTTNIGGWTGCEMRLTHLPNILSLMPAEVQAGIKEVNKLTSAGGLSTNIDTTADKLFLLSEIEIFGAVSMATNGEGEQYAYYSNGGSKVKMNPSRGIEGRWWERSPLVLSNFSTSFCLVATNGTSTNNNADSVNLVAPAFCFGGTSEVDSVFGGYDVARKIKKAYIGIDGVARLYWEAQPDIVTFTVYQNKTDAFTFTMPSGMTFDEAISAGYANGYNANGDTMTLLNTNANGYLMREIRYVSGTVRSSGSVYTDTGRATRAYITDIPIEGNFYDSSGGTVAT